MWKFIIKGAGMTENILEVLLQVYELLVSDLRGQGYDNGLNMQD